MIVCWQKVARQVDDADAVDQDHQIIGMMHLLKMMLKAKGRRGVPQGGIIFPPVVQATGPEPSRGVACTLHADAQEANGTTAEAQECVPIIARLASVCTHSLRWLESPAR
jgi:hypothetical protein